MGTSSGYDSGGSSIYAPQRVRYAAEVERDEVFTRGRGEDFEATYIHNRFRAVREWAASKKRLVELRVRHEELAELLRLLEHMHRTPAELYRSILSLRDELQHTRDQLQQTREEQQQTRADLQHTREELQQTTEHVAALMLHRIQYLTFAVLDTYTHADGRTVIHTGTSGEGYQWACISRRSPVCFRCAYRCASQRSDVRYYLQSCSAITLLQRHNVLWMG
jgi:hypothetical protein